MGFVFIKDVNGTEHRIHTSMLPKLNQQFVKSELSIGRQLRDDALAALEARRKSWVTMCRTFAINHAKRVGEVSINDVRRCFELPSGFHPSTWAAILRCNELQPLEGDDGCPILVQATHKDAHARCVRTYRIKDKPLKLSGRIILVQGERSSTLNLKNDE
jgi:hypothetical protein